MHAAPVQAGKKRFELGDREFHDALADRRPGEVRLIKTLVDQNQSGAVPDQNLYPVGATRTEDHDDARMWVKAELALNLSTAEQNYISRAE